MNGEGRQIVQSTRKFRKYLKDISLLLLCAEAILNGRGYKTYGGNKKVAIDLSSIDSSANNSETWVPQDAFRFFIHKENSNILAVISVIIDDIHKPDSFTQPFVSAAWFDCGKGNSVGNNWGYVLSRAILCLQNFSLDGKMTDLPPDLIEDYKRLKNHSFSLEIVSSQALAVPLVDIQTEHDVEERIIKPLVESLNGKINRSE